ncbi:siderophore ferric iron reductase [Devosia chinhatensis]|uniref:siderophore ferric iron reductase n=1 Tax=Devosia chinhatensis TaxID=429727 RepID=UPI000AFFBBEE|nr:siderophore ferric iron reductase [Devosia chinhatensis]
MRERHFLFAQDGGDAALTRLIATAHAATGFMKGAPGAAPRGWHQLGRDNGAFLRTLQQKLMASYPAAGMPFYAVRLWTNLIWQPAYLSVIATHLQGALPDLSGIAQAQRGIYVDDYRLQPGPQHRDHTEALIGRAGPALRLYADRVLEEIQTIMPLKERFAHYLLAERMLSLMVRLRHFRPMLGVTEQLAFCTLWLDAMGLDRHGQLDVVTLPQGGEAVIVARKGCCLDYRAMPGTLCASCPKQDKTVRTARQRDNASAELSMQSDPVGTA